MESYFHDIVGIVGGLVHADEIHLSTFHAEDSDFVRFNEGRVRQAGSVAMRSLGVDLVRGRRHAAGTVSLSGDRELDRARVARLVDDLRMRAALAPEDPFLLYSGEPRSTTRRFASRVPNGGEALDEIQTVARGHDLVGIYAAGDIYCGFANSFGQRNWYSNSSYNFDWSFVHSADRAVRANYAGFEWRHEDLERKVDAALRQLALLSRPARRVPPGRYRVYLAPAAVAEFVALLGWGGFGLRAHRTKTTPLLRMVEEGERLDRRVRITEDARGGLAPDFQEEGFLRPDELALVHAGTYRECLTSPRSAVEYGASPNGASASEMPNSLELGGGDVSLERVLAELDRGIYIGNVWYLNYSDRAACRMTGTTRFATFWVENGELAAPLEVMRFDETLYRMLGANLVGLTKEQEWILDPSTYSQRSTTTTRVPGALTEDFTLSL